MVGFDLKIDGFFGGGLGRDLEPNLDYKNDMIYISNGILQSISLGFDRVSVNHYDIHIVNHYLMSFDNLQPEQTNYGGNFHIVDSIILGDVVDPTFHLNLINENEPAHLNYYHDGELIGQITLSSSDIENIKMIEIPSEHKDYGDINSVIQIVPN